MRFSQTYTIAGRPTRNRCLVVLMDGTWNDETGKDGDGVVTNVVKLFRCLEPDSDTQVVRYFRGVGNDEENGWLGIKRGGAFGRHEALIRDNAYSTIAKEYHPGDRIFLFGFSRGAASARLLAAQLARDGIPEKITIETEPMENRYTRHVEIRFAGCQAEGRSQDVDVEFLGVWDTVGAFGIPVSILGIPFQKIDLFRDMHVAPNVKKAVHLVSIDETRKAFTPTLMNHNPGVVEEIWFPGVHSDIGGGYDHDQLGRISQAYMIQQLQDHVAGLNGYELRFNDQVLADAIGDLPDHRFHFHGLGYKKALREIHVLENDEPSENLEPQIHSSVFELQDNHEVYSVIRKKRRFLRGIKATLAHVIYNPINVKALRRKYKVVAGGAPHVSLPAKPDTPGGVRRN